MSGPHVEYYSYSFFLENLIGDQYPPFTKTEYYPISGDEEPPCAATENWVRLDKSYGLYFSCWDALKLEIYFEEAKNAAIPDDIGQLLGSKGFVADKNAYVLEIDKDNALQMINTLCIEFPKLK